MLNEAPKEKEKIQADYWWEQVIVLSKYDSKKRGTRRFQCRYCGIQRGGIAMRVKAHLMGLKGHGIGPCGKIPSHERARMEREYVLLPETRGSNNPTTIPASRPPSSSSAATSRGGETISHSSWPQSSRGTQGKQSNLFTSWHPQRKPQVDATVARFFYSCGISFNVARSPFFKEMVAEIAQFGPTYQPPTFDALREKLLEDEVASIKEAILPVRQKWEAYGVSLVGDGWTNIRSTSLEGVLASCRGMPLYIESTECGARQKTAPILCEMWSKAVEYVGPKNVVQFVSDGEATNRLQVKNQKFQRAVIALFGLESEDFESSSSVGNCLGMDGYKEEGSSSQDRQSNPTVHEVGEGSSQAEEGFPHAAFSITGTASPGTLFGGMQSMVPNPMYANIGLHPGFQGTQGQFGVSQGNLGMAGFSIPPVNMTPRHQHVTGQGVQMAPTGVSIIHTIF
ncbi:hypothetical protein L7F22_015430 [Adiantum nelumboides]|nr:hypothetical protein [Adiantum nelumboides]